jgi:hypothetical protein
MPLPTHQSLRATLQLLKIDPEIASRSKARTQHAFNDLNFR